MRFIRRLLICLGLLIALIAVLLAAALTSPVQTWFAQLLLDRQPGLQGSLGSVSAGFGRFEITDLHLESDRWALTLPSLQASLPVKTASWDRNFAVRSLVAKGWTLDLSRTPEPNGTPAAAVSAPAGGTAAPLPVESEVVQKVESIFHGILGGWESPGDVSLDGIDLEGDVLVAVSPDRGPVQVHVIIKGGGMAAGREGNFEFEVEAADPWLRADSVAAHGRLRVAMPTPRTINRIEVKADLTAQGGIYPDGFAVAAKFAATRGPDGESCTLDLARGERHLAAAHARFLRATRRVSGDWKVDLRDTDLALFMPDRPLPPLAAAGEGHFEADTAFTQVHVLGRIDSVASRLAVVAPALERVGKITLAAHFDLTRNGRIVRFDRLDLSLTGARPVAVAQSLQPFEIEAGTGDLKVADPHRDWLDATVQGLPLDWLSGWTGKLALAGGDATGQFTVRAAEGGFAVRPRTPLTATDVSIQAAGRMLGRQLDLSLSMLVEYNPQGWQVQWAPLTISGGGRRLATVEGKASRQGGADQYVTVEGKWSADLAAMAAQPSIPGAGWITARSASGNFSASVGSVAEVEGKLTVTGHDPARTVSASVTADIDLAGGVSFQAPVRFVSGKNVSELLAEGKWSGDETESRLVGKLTGDDVDLEHLRQLAAPLAAVTGWPLLSAATGSAAVPSPEPDRKPFWGKWVGTVTVGFDHLRTRGGVYRGVGGTLELDATSLRLERGRGGLPPRKPVEVEGTVTFDAAADLPYSLKGTVAFQEIDAATLLAPVVPGRDAVIEGLFSVTGKLLGSGRNLEDLVRRSWEEYHVTGTAGIFRLLRTNVADAIPETPTPVADALDSAGSVVGLLFGNKGRTFGSGEKKVNPTTEAVLNFASQLAEIGYDRISVTATRGFDRTIHLSEIELVAPEERLTGTGRISCVQDRSLTAQPLSMDLKLGVRGSLAELVAKTALLSPAKDDQGYRLVVRPIHVGGSLEQLDVSDWRDLLAKAATPKPVAGKVEK